MHIDEHSTTRTIYGWSMGEWWRHPEQEERIGRRSQGTSCWS